METRLFLDSFAALKRLGLDKEIVDALKSIADDIKEEQVVACFLKALVDTGLISSKKEANLYTRMAERFLLTESSLLRKTKELLSDHL